VTRFGPAPGDDVPVPDQACGRGADCVRHVATRSRRPESALVGIVPENRYRSDFTATVNLDGIGGRDAAHARWAWWTNDAG
jgi:hypothetical protein